MAFANENDAEAPSHGLVGLRPLPRDEADWKSNHGGSWRNTPTYEAQKVQYPFVADLTKSTVNMYPTHRY